VPDTLEIRAFGHVVVPIAVVIAMGVARIVSSVGDYIRNRGRVRFALGHGLWSAILFLVLVGLWWTVWGLRRIDADAWSFFVLIFLLIGPCCLFLSTSLLFPSVPDEGPLDLETQLQDVGRAFFLAMLGFLVWLFVVSLTGVINTLSIPIFGQWQATELTEMTAPYLDEEPVSGYGSVDAVLETIDDNAAEKALSFLAFPGNDFASPGHYVAFMQGTTALSSKLLTPLLIDAGSAAFVESRNLPWYVQTLLLSQPLHFGDYGGMPMKLLWALLDILAIVVLGSGVYLWMKTRNVGFESWFGRMEESRHTNLPSHGVPE